MGTITDSVCFSPDILVLRTSLLFNDLSMTNLIPPNGRAGNQVLPSDPICKDTQQAFNQTKGSPALQASAGDIIALRYQENGHVTLPNITPNKPSPGLVFVYGTAESRPDDALKSIYTVWTSDQTGGDGRGRLLLQTNFDDRACYQVNPGPISKRRQSLPQPDHDAAEGADLWCKNVLRIPDDVTQGFYTLYWVWDRSTPVGSPGAPQGIREIYTTCIDVQII